ncbi:MAG: glycerol-3-phosphate dehydrogenase C-terminal domain-containing protein, partial [Saprospiraceae bacterium]|nr:glycerol-3-phosphate dehydrogenase C-terminal domain-containing protein [Saprospiraceae bacterium]
NHTDKIPLEGGPFHGVVEVEKYLEEIRIRLAGKDLPSYYPDYLVANYGKQCDRILDKMESFDDGTDEIRLVRAELRHAVEEELALTAMDFFNRRTGRLYFNMPSIARIREVVLGDMAEILDWGPEKRREEQEALDRAIERVTLFEPASAGKGS